MIKVDKYDLVNRIEEELYIRNSLETYEVNKTEVYKALAKCIRDIIAYSWSPSKDKLFSKKQIYLFSFEYNTSNFLSKNLNYLGLSQVARESLGILGYNFDEILNCEVFPLLGEGELGDLSYFMLESNCKNRVKAYGLRYENGRFKQEIIDHRKVEMVKSWTMEEFPWEIKRNRDDINIFGKDIKSTAYDIKVLTKKYPGVDFVYPMHLNPHVRKPIHEVFGEDLSDLGNMFFIEPLEYLAFVYLMEKSNIVLTDSGGIQEEAPGLGKPVLVMRDTTERPEALDAGTVKLVGTNYDKILNEVSALLDDTAYYERMSKAVNPYGDGMACGRIVSALSNE